MSKLHFNSLTMMSIAHAAERLTASVLSRVVCVTVSKRRGTGYGIGKNLEWRLSRRGYGNQSIRVEDHEREKEREEKKRVYREMIHR